MQLYALDRQKQLISAKQANKHQDYTCLECQGIVRVRGGIHRQNHFFHLEPGITCHLSGKSMVHLQIQCFLQGLIPDGESRLEYRFSTINRIADVIWFNRKLIFEIQCSPISKEEVERRNNDYGSQGYQVVWVLHDNQFNQWKVSAAELWLRRQPFYYTNMDADGCGEIYDQFDLVVNGIRRHRLKGDIVDLHRPCFLEVQADTGMSKAPIFIQERVNKVPICFEGDLVQQFMAGKLQLSESFEKILEVEKALISQTAVAPVTFWDTLKGLVGHYVVRPYLLMLQVLLERACK